MPLRRHPGQAGMACLFFIQTCEDANFSRITPIFRLYGAESFAKRAVGREKLLNFVLSIIFLVAMLLSSSKCRSIAT